MSAVRLAGGCLALVLAAMGGCTDSGQEAPEAVPVRPGTQRGALSLGTPELVADLQPTPSPSKMAGSDPQDFVRLGTLLYFTAYDPVHGRELWKTDGTAAGTVLVKDLNPGSLDSQVSELTAHQGLLYFIAYDGSGPWLWKSDGTAAGTWPLFSYDDPSFGLNVFELESIGHTLFLAATSGNGFHLWKSDGTREGTRVMKSLRPGGSFPQRLRNVNGTLYYVDDDGVNGSELWKSDGTAEGTMLVTDINPASGGSLLSEFTAVGAVSYVLAGGSLWKSDGTPGGTVRLTHPLGTPGPSAGRALSGLQGLTAIGRTLYFAADDGVNGSELWKSDGTVEGTVQVVELESFGGSFPSDLCDVNGALYFQATQGSSLRALWKTDGTATGTVRLTGTWADPVAGRMAVVGSRVYFFVVSRLGPYYLWTSDGTENSGHAVYSFAPARSDLPIPQAFGALGDTLFFSGDEDTYGRELMMSSRTPGVGTLLVKDLYRAVTDGSVPRNLMDLGGGKILFSVVDGTGRALWSSDGTQAGTLRVRSGFKSLESGSLRVGGVVYFKASTAQTGSELWRSDGTAEGTFLLKDLNPGVGDSLLTFHAQAHGRLYFIATTPALGQELWVSDGTPEGTRCVKDIRPGSGSSSAAAASVVNVGGRIYFGADDGVHGSELWTTDGTEAGTVLLADLRPGSLGSGPRSLVDYNGRLFFSAFNDDPTGGPVLWKLGADGHPRKISIPSAGSATHLRVVNGTLFFFVIPPGAESYSRELWKYDGTSERATLVVKERFTFYTSTEPVPAGRLLYFRASDPRGEELWRTDGTAEGTHPVKDILPARAEGLERGGPLLGLTDRGQVLFTATDGVTGVEPWASDGSEAGTSLVADLAPGTRASLPREYTRSGDSVFFRANDGVRGWELWRILLPPLPPDTTAPVLVCPASVTLEAVSATGTPVSWPEARVSDEGTASVPVMYSPLPGTRFPVGTTTVTVTAKDEAGNEATCAFDVTVRDTTAPAVRCPAQVDAEATSATGARVTYAAEATDNGSPVTVAYEPASGSELAFGFTVVKVTGRDAVGNEDACTFPVRVRDSTAPVVGCPAAVTVEATGPEGAPVPFASASVTDGVTASPEVTYSHAAGSTFPVGEASVTVTAKDKVGNASSCSFPVVVRDTTAPVLTCPSGLELESGESSGRVVEYPAATARDAVTAEPRVTYSHASGSTFPVGSTSVTATVRDAAGNTASCSFRVTVRPPVSGGGEGPVGGGEEGLGCGATGGSPTGLWGALVLLAGGALRRPSARRVGTRLRSPAIRGSSSPGPRWRWG